MDKLRSISVPWDILIPVALFIALTFGVWPVDRLLSFDLGFGQALKVGVDSILAWADGAHLGRPAEILLHLPISDAAIFLLPMTIALLLFQRRWIAAAIVAASALAAYGAGQWLKVALHRLRPGETPADGYLFPSGHTLAVVLATGYAAYIIARGRARNTALTVIVLAVTINLASALSLTYFNYHYATDIVGATALGTAWIAATIRLLRPLEFRARHARSLPCVEQEHSAP